MIIMEQVEEGAIDTIELAESIDTTTKSSDQNFMQMSRDALEVIETIIADYVDSSE